LGIATTQPNALLHVNTQNIGTLPGLIVDNANPAEAPPEFIVNSDGSLFIYDNIPTNGDIFNLNTQAPPDQFGSNSIYNKFRVTGSGYVGIGSKYTNSDAPPQNNVSAYKMLTVNGDASFANGTSGESDGLSALEILGDGAVPARRGISVTRNAVGGNLNFYINSNQTNSQFNFVDGKNGVVSSTNPALVTIGSDGSTLINSTSSTNAPLTIKNISGGTTTPLFLVNTDGSTSIGNDGSGNNTVPAGYQLAVYGKIIAKEVVVKLLPWPDYVFTKNYKLKNLLDLENYINENHHLPNIPAAKDVEVSGVQLGDMVGKQMEKIEELTLYMIEMKKEIEKLKQENKELKVLINK